LIAKSEIVIEGGAAAAGSLPQFGFLLILTASFQGVAGAIS